MMIDCKFRTEIKTYEDALKRYESIKPIRGRKDNLRPMYERRKKYMHVVKDEHTGAVSFNISRIGALVTYNTDGSILFASPRWSDHETVCFTSDALGVDLHWSGYKVVLPLLYNNQKVYAHVPTDKRLVLRREGAYLTPTEDPSQYYYVHVAQDVKAVNAALKPYKGFLTYVKAVAKLNHNPKDIRTTATLPYLLTTNITSLVSKANLCNWLELARNQDTWGEALNIYVSSYHATKLNYMQVRECIIHCLTLLLELNPVKHTVEPEASTCRASYENNSRAYAYERACARFAAEGY